MIEEIRLRAPTLEDVLQIGYERAAVQSALRTPYMLTSAQQRQFYEEVISNRQSPHRYYSIQLGVSPHTYKFIGLGGLTFIQPENGTSQLSEG